MMTRTLLSLFLILASLHANAAQNGFSDWNASNEHFENVVSRKLYVDGSVACTQFKLAEQHADKVLAKKWDSGCQKYRAQLMKEAAKKSLSAASHRKNIATLFAKGDLSFFD